MLPAQSKLGSCRPSTIPGSYKALRTISPEDLAGNSSMMRRLPHPIDNAIGQRRCPGAVEVGRRPYRCRFIKLRMRQCVVNDARNINSMIATPQRTYVYSLATSYTETHHSIVPDWPTKTRY
jgi:hypothetical protein